MTQDIGYPLFYTRCYALHGQRNGTRYDVAACESALVKWSDGADRHTAGRTVADFFSTTGEYIGPNAAGVEPLFAYGRSLLIVDVPRQSGD